jgi:hypothetical protein
MAAFDGRFGEHESSAASSTNADERPELASKAAVHTRVLARDRRHAAARQVATLRSLTAATNAALSDRDEDELEDLDLNVTPARHVCG